MSCFSERSPIPKNISYELLEEGKLGPEIQRDTREGIVREVGAELIFDVALAEQIIEWLQRHVADAKRIPSKANNQGETE